MAAEENTKLEKRIDKVRRLTEGGSSTEWYEAASLAQSVIHDTVGGAHPLTATLRHALESKDFYRAVAAARAVVSLFDEGNLQSPRLAIAHEIEGSLLDIAQSQLEAAEKATEPSHKQVHLAVSAFLAGASLEDALRRLCDARGIAYDAQRTSIAKLQGALFQPSKQIEAISGSENKQITSWGDTRNRADHGKFGEITYAEIVSMVVGVRAFIDRHLP